MRILGKSMMTLFVVLMMSSCGTRDNNQFQGHWIYNKDKSTLATNAMQGELSQLADKRLFVIEVTRDKQVKMAGNEMPTASIKLIRNEWKLVSDDFTDVSVIQDTPVRLRFYSVRDGKVSNLVFDKTDQKIFNESIAKVQNFREEAAKQAESSTSEKQGLMTGVFDQAPTNRVGELVGNFAGEAYLQKLDLALDVKIHIQTNSDSTAFGNIVFDQTSSGHTFFAVSKEKSIEFTLEVSSFGALSSVCYGSKLQFNLNLTAEDRLKGKMGCLDQDENLVAQYDLDLPRLAN